MRTCPNKVTIGPSRPSEGKANIGKLAVVNITSRELFRPAIAALLASLLLFSCDTFPSYGYYSTEPDSISIDQIYDALKSDPDLQELNLSGGNSNLVRKNPFSDELTETRSKEVITVRVSGYSFIVQRTSARNDLNISTGVTRRTAKEMDEIRLAAEVLLGKIVQAFPGKLSRASFQEFEVGHRE